ncbi:MAG: integrase arm-type DNA-binding domain-containing protein [Pseudomonadota bacterium]
MTTNRLTDKVLSSAKARDKDYTLSDGDGLYLLVTTIGSKLWRIAYQFNKHPGLLSLGSYPAVSLARAREKRLEIQILIDNGIDPSEERRKKKYSDEFGKIAKIWFEKWKKTKAKGTAIACWRRLERYILPVLSKRKIDRLVSQDYVIIARQIAENRGAEVALRCFLDCKQITRFAHNEGIIKAAYVLNSKAKDIFESRSGGRHARVELNELSILVSAINAYPKIEIKCALLLMSLTFVRTMELLDTPWSEIDFQNGLWSIPAHRMKMRTPHIVPLCTQALGALAILKALSHENEEWKNSGKVFPWVGNGRRNTLLKALYSMGYKGRMTGHGFRAVAKSAMLRNLKIEERFIEVQLAHFKRDAYVDGQEYFFLEERKVMMQQWADYLNRLSL